MGTNGLKIELSKVYGAFFSRVGRNSEGEASMSWNAHCFGYLDEYFMPHRRYESNEMKKERQFKSCNLILFNNFKERLGIIHKS